MLISPAYAQTGGAGGFDIMSLLPLVLIFVVFYFLLIRPQQKKMKDHKAMISAVKRGDTVVTAGGMIGKVTKVVDDTTVQVEIADNVRVRVVKATLADVRARGPESAAGDKDEPESKTPETVAADAGEKKGGLLSKLKR